MSFPHQTLASSFDPGLLHSGVATLVRRTTPGGEQRELTSDRPTGVSHCGECRNASVGQMMKVPCEYDAENGARSRCPAVVNKGVAPEVAKAMRSERLTALEERLS